ncbi:MAG: hypothetical protein HKN87_06125 [Saprospiraceae bacterium]|nr:hypothetical protein [Saprospiraceae bacterium]
MKSTILLLPALLSLLFVSHIFGTNNPKELGKVQWQRNMDDALTLAEAGNKPVLILFQEVPGCMTCQRYGNVVLSHPLIVEAIETYFVPLAIHNNKGGKDKAVLDYYKEPSWNNPVVRMVGADKKDLLPRLSANYSPSGLVAYMIQGLEKLNSTVPTYLRLLEEELLAQEGSLEKATLSMYCFWTGEKELGKIEGVVATEPGFMDRREVVNVYFNPSLVGLEDIVTHGSEVGCGDVVYTYNDAQRKKATRKLGAGKVKESKSFRIDAEPKYYLSKTIYQFIPMTPMQAMKANALVGLGKKPESVLSPRQIIMLRHIKKGKHKWRSAIHADDWQFEFYKRWQEVAKAV